MTFFRALHERSSDSPPLHIRTHCDGVEPASMPIVSRHGGANDGSGNLGDEEKVSLHASFCAMTQRGTFRAAGVRKDGASKLSDGLLIRFAVRTNQYLRVDLSNVHAV